MREVWTIGHSTHSIEAFVALLKAFSITVLVDVRHYPGSRRYPHFNKEELDGHLKESGIDYVHMVDLGGRRKPAKDSRNNAWKNEAFRGYADHMGSETFQKAASELEDIASKKRTVYMCSEAVWWSCHRALISDHLKNKGWKVLHIMNEKKADEHPWTKPARIVEGELRYDIPGLF